MEQHEATWTQKREHQQKYEGKSTMLLDFAAFVAFDLDPAMILSILQLVSVDIHGSNLVSLTSMISSLIPS